MKIHLPFACALLALAALGARQLSAADDASVAPEQVRAAVRKALPPIEASSAEYLRKVSCFGCHHQAASIFTLSVARERGFRIDEENFQAQVKRTEGDLRSALVNYRAGRGQGGGATRAGYALWTLGLAGWKPDETTQTVAQFLIDRDAAAGPWRSGSQRPPSEGSAFTATAVSLLGLQPYAGDALREKAAERNTRILAWARQTAPADNEERVFRLWTLQLLGEKELSAAVRELKEKQQADGGWSQLDGQPTDAYATGSALVALHRAGGLTTDDPAYRRGLAYLVRTQGADGTWRVKTRSRPIQQYFESGFPHGKDQFISMAGTCWATAALAEACSAK